MKNNHFWSTKKGKKITSDDKNMKNNYFWSTEKGKHHFWKKIFKSPLVKKYENNHFGETKMKKITYGKCFKIISGEK